MKYFIIGLALIFSGCATSRMNTMPVSVGMTRAQVYSAWGEAPDYYIHKTVTKYGVDEQIKYFDGAKTKYVYLHNGVCEAVQE